MLEEFNKLLPKPQNIAELKVALKTISNNLPDETIRKSEQSDLQLSYVLRFRKQLVEFLEHGFDKRLAAYLGLKHEEDDLSTQLIN